MSYLALEELQARNPHYHLKQHLANGSPNPDWLALRGLGSTSISKLLCVSGSVKDRRAVFNRLHGLSYEEEDISHLPAIQHGNQTEDEAFDCFWNEYDYRSKWCGLKKCFYQRPGLLQYLHEGWICFVSEDQHIKTQDILLTDSPDFMLVEESTKTCLYMGEIKCPHTRARAWTPSNLPYNYYLQCQWHCLVSGVPHCLFVDYLKGQLMSVMQINHDVDLTAKMLELAHRQLQKVSYTPLPEHVVSAFKDDIVNSRFRHCKKFFEVSLSHKRKRE